MKVFLDSNVFVKKNWFVSNANFKLLFHFLNNNHNELLLSKLVIQEVNNIRDRELSEVLSGFKKLIKDGNKLNKQKLVFSESELGVSSYNISSILTDKVHYIEQINYDEISHIEVVNRALKLVKPFTGEEKGYRDTLIWLSFLNYLKKNNVTGDVAFITNNKSDFFKQNRSSLAFNDDLKNDIENFGLKTNIIPYLNIFDFITDKVDKIENSINKYEILDDLESFLIEETEEYLDSMTNHNLSDLLSAKVFSDKLTAVIDIESDIFEGVEDPDVQSVSQLPENNVYISCYYEMRRVDLVITIETIEYKQHADEIEAIRGLYNIEIDEGVVKLSFICRLCIDASFEYDTAIELGSNLTIHDIQTQS